MFKRICVLVLMFLYIYTLTFNIFMTGVFRIPTPLLFAVPLIILFKDERITAFKYSTEVVVFFIAAMFYFLFGQGNIIAFFSVIIIITCCALFFNFFVGDNSRRFRLSVWLFYAMLSLSAIVMLLDHLFDIGSVRSLLIGEQILQSPSGISVTIFTYGYQLAALTAFLVILSATKSKSVIVNFLTIGICLVLILYGMQRSVLIVFVFSLFLFWLFYYRLKAALLLVAVCIISVSLNSSIQKLSSGKQQNILNKNEKNKDAGENRGELMTENLKVISDYPFGLIFYGKKWEDVVKHNVTYKSGNKVITSHNAYLMFITYLGIVLGLIFFWLIYKKIGGVIWFALKHIRDKNNALLVCLCISFISISLNSLFHNEWLLAASGPCLFLYFGILHLKNLTPQSKD